MKIHVIQRRSGRYYATVVAHELAGGSGFFSAFGATEAAARAAVINQMSAAARRLGIELRPIT